MQHHKPDEIPVILESYEYTTWLFPETGRFPRDLRFSLGQRLEGLSLDLLELLIEAKYQKNKYDSLNRANTKIEVSRFLLRLARDQRALSEKAFWKGIGHLMEIGQQIGGWLKQQRLKPQ